MLIREATAKVRSKTLHDDDEQFSNDQLRDDCLIDEYRRLRVWLCTYVPALCEAVASGIVVSGGAGVIPKASLPNFERLTRVERLEGSAYVPIHVEAGLLADVPRFLSVREQPAQLLISPAQNADGTYQVVYSSGAPADINDDDEIDLPHILCQVLVERGCAWVCARHSGDRERLPYHEKREAALMLEALPTLVHRYGDHGESALRREGWR
jgi:hypothetical protein